MEFHNVPACASLSIPNTRALQPSDLQPGVLYRNQRFSTAPLPDRSHSSSDRVRRTPVSAVRGAFAERLPQSRQSLLIAPMNDGGPQSRRESRSSASEARQGVEEAARAATTPS